MPPVIAIALSSPPNGEEFLFADQATKVNRDDTFDFFDNENIIRLMPAQISYFFLPQIYMGQHATRDEEEDEERKKRAFLIDMAMFHLDMLFQNSLLN